MFRLGFAELIVVLVIVAVPVAIVLAVVLSIALKSHAEARARAANPSPDSKPPSFCPSCGRPIVGNPQFCMTCGAKLVQLAVVSDVSTRSRLAAALLAFFLGGFGAHRFYLGKTGTAVAMLLLTIFGFLATAPLALIGVPMLLAAAIWAFVDFIIIVVGNASDANGKLVKNW